MNKFQAMAKIMLLLNEDGLLRPGSHVYHTVRRMIADKIDRLGPEAALVNVVDGKVQLLDRIKILAMWHKSAGGSPSKKF
ncbi:MAG: hypothetical protein KFF68_09600 [Desulfosarcina sp.]|nr:hypothetical protein [Desulfosarcina sp.]